ncbi:IS982 family transposase [Nostoc sp. 'Peltigera malacea cyanobiont' DB3992]|uniref:IS982 family transposase n=1 Tax=Nostoc sp. 'Peltigera malacea cyanobiont' DB3992 TaxID=1206980 RepID=UPI000C03D2CC|nr:IS982 family transposase [Nostoc sp. 'Peltigera malacea cyanobiont' DB3992]PHM05880.1 IS982 family transposase [Nostoc sp. 'Peltigera malacea cyanobiont' DB3992]
MSTLEELFCSVDDFCQTFEPQWERQLLGNGLQKRKRGRSLCLSEIMTIVIGFHQSCYRNFKAYYQDKVQVQWQAYFPGLVSYHRFVEWMPSTLLPLCAYLRSCFGSCTGISFLDSTSLKVCHNRRINQHRVFQNLAARGKTSVDWFFGFKLHVVVNDRGELLNVVVTPGNTDDRIPVPKLLQMLFGKVFADKGYVSQKLAKQLLETVGIQLITKLKRNMKNRFMSLSDRLLLRKRSIIETIIDQFKNISQIEHSRHRSPVNCLVNILCGLIAYCHQPKKPAIAIDHNLLSAA